MHIGPCGGGQSKLLQFTGLRAVGRRSDSIDEGKRRLRQVHIKLFEQSFLGQRRQVHQIGDRVPDREPFRKRHTRRAV